VSPRVFVFSPIDAAAETYQNLQQRGCKIDVAPRPWASPMAPTPEALLAGARDSDVLLGSMIYNTTVSREVMQSADRLRLVAKYSIGCEDVDVEAATDLGILVSYGPTESNWGGVAEGTLANMLVLLKKIRERDRYLKTDGPVARSESRWPLCRVPRRRVSGADYRDRRARSGWDPRRGPAAAVASAHYRL